MSYMVSHRVNYLDKFDYSLVRKRKFNLTATGYTPESSFEYDCEYDIFAKPIKANKKLFNIENMNEDTDN